MVKMRSMVIFFTFMGVAATLAKTSISPEMNACRQIELMVGIEFLAKGKDIPITWGEIPTIQRMRNETQGEYVDTSSINLLRHLNSFAIVPHAPVIVSEPGISKKRAAKRLFAISRDKNLASEDASGQAEGGRYAVLLSNDGNATEPHWIPESEANIILSQFKEFDPSNQPLPFPDIVRISKLSEERKQKSLQVIREHHRGKASKKKEHEIQSHSYKEGTILRWVWMALGLLIVALAGIYGYSVLRRRKV